MRVSPIPIWPHLNQLELKDPISKLAHNLRYWGIGLQHVFWGTQVYNNIGPLLEYHTEWFHCPQNPLCSTYLPSPSSQPLATTNLFTVSIALLFPGVLWLESTVYSPLDWLLSLSNMLFKVSPRYFTDSSFSIVEKCSMIVYYQQTSYFKK